jgi:hypothetical protein
VIRIMCYLLNIVKVFFVDPQLKLFMKSVNGQFARFQNFMAGMKEELQEKKASQSASTPRDDMRTLPQILHGCNDDEYQETLIVLDGANCIP